MDKQVRWQVNPVLVKELRSRMRGVRAFATLTGVLVILGLFSFSLYRMVLATSRYSSMPLSPQIGQALFAGLVFLELMMVSAVTPSVTAGAISGEQEKETYEMLLATPLHPASILWGKLISALSYVLLLIFAAVPMASLVFIFGGVTIRDMFKAAVMLMVIAVMFGVIGLFMSALFGRTGRATALSYLVILLMLFGPLFVAIVVGVMKQSDPPRWLLFPSPISALGSALMPSTNTQSISSMFWMLGNTPAWILGSPQISYTDIPRPLYHFSLPLYGAITLVCYFLATRLVRPARRWKFQWPEILLALVLVVGFLGVTILAYGMTTNRYENYLTNPLATSTPAPVMTRPIIAPPPSPGFPSVVETAVPQSYPAPGVSPAQPGIFPGGTPTAFPYPPKG